MIVRETGLVGGDRSTLRIGGGSVGGGRCIEIYLYPRYLYKNSKRDPTHSLGISGVETAKVLMDKV